MQILEGVMDTLDSNPRGQNELRSYLADLCFCCGGAHKVAECTSTSDLAQQRRTLLGSGGGSSGGSGGSGSGSGGGGGGGGGGGTNRSRKRRKERDEESEGSSESEEAPADGGGGSSSSSSRIALKRSEVSAIFGATGAALESPPHKFLRFASTLVRGKALRDAAFQRTESWNASGNKTVTVALQPGWRIIPGHNMLGTFGDDRGNFRRGVMLAVLLCVACRSVCNLACRSVVCWFIAIAVCCVNPPGPVARC